MYQQGVFVNTQKNAVVEGELLQIKGHRSRGKGTCDNLSSTESLSKPLISATVWNLPLNSLLWLCPRDLSVSAEGEMEHRALFCPEMGSKLSHSWLQKVFPIYRYSRSPIPNRVPGHDRVCVHQCNKWELTVSVLISVQYPNPTLEQHRQLLTHPCVWFSWNKVLLSVPQDSGTVSAAKCPNQTQQKQSSNKETYFGASTLGCW